MTRPEPGATETAARLTERGLTPIIVPMLIMENLPARLPERVDAVLLTSRNGLTGLPASLHDRPVFAVGAATAALARAQGFSLVISADGDAEALAALVGRQAPRPRSLLLPTARGQGGDLATRLRRDGFAVHRRAVYRARPATSLPAEVRTALEGGTVGTALFFSAETARVFVAAVRHARLDTAARGMAACAIGKAAAVALEALPWRRLRIAARPTQDDLLALIE